uniref:Procollagen C-endopeptidase enhancer 2 n=2 Tax=Canis lupus familiaris TaxID=9615 RepID=A0A8C0MJ11_CANLF
MRGAGAWAALGLLLAAAAQRSPQQPPERPVFTCGGILTGESGFIGSEGFPGVYPPNSKCTWKITVPEGKVVVLNFRFIDLESDNLCRYDFVDVYNGHTNGQRIGRFCGTFRPGALVSSGNKMMVQMISDANTAGNGFMAMFSAAEPNERGDQYCGGRLERPSGSFKTPNWPDRDYPAGVTCMWHIVAPKNQLIELKFEKFDVERDNYCRYDFVAVFNGGEVNDAKRIGKYCGDSPPAPIVSERNELLIQFLSDLSLTADGFIGHYKFRPKKLPTTTVPPVTTTFPVTTGLKPTVSLCQQKCRRTGTLESNYCSSNFVLLTFAFPVILFPNVFFCSVGWHCDHNCHPRWEFACHSLYHQHLRGKFGNSAGWQEHECQGHRGLQAVPAPQKRSELHYYGPSG